MRMTTLRRAIRWGLLLPLLLVAGLALAATAGALLPRPLAPPPASGPVSVTKAEDVQPVAPDRRRILLLSNAIHTDIAIPVDADSLSRLGFVGASDIPVDDPAAQWVVFGWGGRAFYLETPTWADLKPLPLLRGLTLDRSVLHVDVAGEIPLSAEGVEAFDIDPAAYVRLLDFIAASFARSNGQAMPIPGFRYGRNDGFFEANGWFTALLGCNTWTATGLREAGLRTGLWNPLPASLAFSLKRFNL
jgi:uncharacterized protein (TIGR02117 family)